MKKRVLIGLVVAAVLVSAWSLGASAYVAMQPYGEITSPGDGGLVFGLTDFEAVYFDDDPGGVQWAVRYGTCAAATNTVFGNVDGHSDPYSWDGSSFHATADTSTWTPGHYCFVLNPREEADEQDVRLTRWFWVVDRYVGGGGQLIEQVGSKRQDWHVISFGGGVGRAGASGYVGEWEVNFHNVGIEDFDRTSFHTTSIDVMNFYRAGCGVAMNFTATGVWNGNPGYEMIFRTQDAGEPGSNDNARVEIFDSGGAKVYDTWFAWRGEFTNESNCVGTARTGLDHGNLQMEGW